MSETGIRDSVKHKAASKWARFCPRCGYRIEERFINVEQKLRMVCGDCGFIKENI